MLLDDDQALACAWRMAARLDELLPRLDRAAYLILGGRCDVDLQATADAAEALSLAARCERVAAAVSDATLAAKARHARRLAQQLVG